MLGLRHGDATRHRQRFRCGDCARIDSGDVGQISGRQGVRARPEVVGARHRLTANPHRVVAGTRPNIGIGHSNGHIKIVSNRYRMGIKIFKVFVNSGAGNLIGGRTEIDQVTVDAVIHHQGIGACAAINSCCHRAIGKAFITCAEINIVTGRQSAQHRIIAITRHHDVNARSKGNAICKSASGNIVGTISGINRQPLRCQ